MTALRFLTEGYIRHFRPGCRGVQILLPPLQHGNVVFINLHYGLEKKSHLRFLIEIVLSFRNLRENHCVSVSPLTLTVWSRTHASPQSTSPQFFRYCPGTQGESILMEQNVKSHVNLYQIYLKSKTHAVQRFSLSLSLSLPHAYAHPHEHKHIITRSPPTYLSTPTTSHIRLRARMHTHTHARTHARTHTRIHTHTHTHTHTHKHIDPKSRGYR